MTRWPRNDWKLLRLERFLVPLVKSPTLRLPECSPLQSRNNSPIELLPINLLAFAVNLALRSIFVQLRLVPQTLFHFRGRLLLLNLLQQWQKRRLG